MHQTLMVKLDPSVEQHQALLETMHRFNAACNCIAETAFSAKTANKIRLQQQVYHEVRERFGLSAQLTIRAIAKVVEAFKRDRNIRPVFKAEGSVVYDQRILSWKRFEKVSILSLKGRLKIPIRIGDYQRARMDGVRGEVDVIYRKGVFYLAVVVDAPEPSKFEATGVLGVDLGMANIAVDSDGEAFSGDRIEKARVRFAGMRMVLQSVGTGSAKAHLKKLSGKEERFRRNVNHVVSKLIVAKAKDTVRAVALEDLTGVRRAVTVRKAQRSRSHSWAFRQLRTFIEYKAALAGVPVVLVNPRGTSHVCPKCGHNERKNRPNRDVFRCVRCGFSGHADHVAAVNIAARAAANQPIVVCSAVEAQPGTETKHNYKPMNLFMGS